MRSLLRSMLPQPVRMRLRLIQRCFRDIRTGLRSRLVEAEGPCEAWQARLTLQQPILSAPHVNGKRHNLGRAAETLNDRVILPGKVFSLAAMLGPTSQKRGYQIGRMLADSEVAEEYGGGLCQLSGLLYHLALRAGLEIIERHPHSMDIYKEEARFCPLGSDATLVYGWKDLRLGNPFLFPLAFRIDVKDNMLIGHVCGPQEMDPRHIEFLREDRKEHMRIVTTRIDGKTFSIDRYPVFPASAAVK